LIGRIGLSRGVARTHIGFMGCHAALNALRVVDAFVGA
jgi:predicted naringenin-chalcone synthase